MKSIFILIFCLPFAAYAKAETAVEAKTKANQPCVAECDSESTPQEKSMEAPSEEAYYKHTIDQNKPMKVFYEDNEYTKQMIEIMDSSPNFIFQRNFDNSGTKKMWNFYQVKQIKTLAIWNNTAFFLDNKNRCFTAANMTSHSIRMCNETEKQIVMDAPSIYPSQSIDLEKLQQIHSLESTLEAQHIAIIAILAYQMHFLNTEILPPASI